ncbi:MAG: hypothetical protein H6854_01015 [Rhodospirillales bacterium]|nr:hypothetical protein [Rhodospirillales bacterium]
MSEFHKSPAYILLLLFCTAVSALLLSLFPKIVPVIVILWSVAGFDHFLNLTRSAAPLRTGKHSDQKNVVSLLGGLEKKFQHENALRFQAGTKPLLIAALVCALGFCILIFLHTANETALRAMALVMLGGLIFWIFQSICLSVQVAMASILIFGGLSVLFIGANLPGVLFHWGRLTSNYLNLYGAGCLSVFAGYVFVRGLLIRRHYRIFPMVGLCGSIGILLLLLFAEEGAWADNSGLFVAVAAFLGACVAQSFPRYHYSTGRGGALRT